MRQGRAYLLDTLTEITESWAGLFQTGPTIDLKYDYDIFDRRVSRSLTVTPDGGEGGSGPATTTVEKYVYDGDHVVLDFLKPDGGSFALEHRYPYGPAVDQVLAQENVASSSVLWMLVDNERTVRDLVNNSGQLAQHYTYDAFGGMLSGDQTLTRYFYTGREFDAATGLQYNRERWYDPHSGRWLTQDPIGFAAGDSNLYRYVGNSPTNATDPTGLNWFYDFVEYIYTVFSYAGPAGGGEAAGALQCAPNIIRIADVQRAHDRYLQLLITDPNGKETEQARQDWVNKQKLHKDQFCE